MSSKQAKPKKSGPSRKPRRSNKDLNRLFARFRLEKLGILLAIALAVTVTVVVLGSFLQSVASFFITVFGVGVIFLVLSIVFIGLIVYQERFPSIPWNKILSFGLFILVFFGFLSLLPYTIQLAGVQQAKVSAGGSLGILVAGSQDALGLLRVGILAIVAVGLLDVRKTVVLCTKAGETTRTVISERLLPKTVLNPANSQVEVSDFSSQSQSDYVATNIEQQENITPPSDTTGTIAETIDPTALEEAIPKPPDSRPSLWQLPPIDILDSIREERLNVSEIERTKQKIEETLAQFRVPARVVGHSRGPSVTQFEVEPLFDIRLRIAKGKDGKAVHVEEQVKVKVSRITSLANDLALALAAPSIRIEAPVPGRPYVGIEVPNVSMSLVPIRAVIETPQFQRLKMKTKLALALGKGVDGRAVATDLAKMPHLLIAGATGSGKSVCINSIISCLLMHTTPDDVKLIMIDPKRVELTNFNHIPHLLSPVVVDIEKVVGVLKWIVDEMDSRYRKFADAGARNIEAYNKNLQPGQQHLPFLIPIVDELADLMMIAPIEVERMICRLAQLGRAAGIHIIIATQRPSVDVITGLIKANFPTRISFAVASQIDSRTILDMGGAEKLLGRGDMLFMGTDASKPTRLQGSFLSDQEIERIVNFWRKIREPQYLPEIAKAAEMSMVSNRNEDPLLEEARNLTEVFSKVSASLLQRKLRIGYNRAARLMEQLEEEGLVDSNSESKSNGSHFDEDSEL